jgi:hypothetical protein
MEKFSQIIDPFRLSIPAYMRDHRLGGQAVLPAVETLRILSDRVRKHRPQTAGNHMCDIAFSRLLPIGPDDAAIDLWAIIRPVSNDQNSTSGVLSTRFTSKSGTITRMKEHVSAIFSTASGAPSASPPPPIDDMLFSTRPTGFSVAADRLYRDLVPFGPGFQSLVGNVRLSPSHASGMAGTPVSAHPMHSTLGSPFPLDAAFHVACAWGQRYARTVVYPVAIRERTIFKATVSGENYATLVQPVGKAGDTLSFDIQIESLSGEIFETIRGVDMKPISEASTCPPDWIIA